MCFGRESNPYGHFCPQDFLATSCYHDRHDRQGRRCSLDYFLTIATRATGCRCIVSLRLCSLWCHRESNRLHRCNLVPRCPRKGFRELACFYIHPFGRCTLVILSKSCVSTNSTTKAPKMVCKVTQKIAISKIIMQFQGQPGSYS